MTPGEMAGRIEGLLLMQGRFWSFVDRRGRDDCWPWLGWRSPEGPSRLPYGRFYLSKKRTMRAHKLAWIIHNRMLVPDGLVVAHSCDHAWCCNPMHLWIGTVAENNADRDQKGRGKPTKLPDDQRWKVSGHRHGRAKITSEQAREIRGSAEPSRSLAEKVGLSWSQVCRIRRRDNWGDNATKAALRALQDAQDGAP